MRSAKLFVAASILALIAQVPSGPATAAPPADAKADAKVDGKADAKPDVATLLFSDPQWGHAPVGSVITYDYAKKTTDAAFGPSFEDTIKLTLAAGDDAESRTAEVQMFSGANRKPAGPFKSDKQNPVLLLVFEANAQELSKLFKANVRYLKNAIRKAWRENAQIEKTDIMVAGKPVPGTRITIAPYAGDVQADQMKGLDGMVYVVEIADSVPGTIANIDIHAPRDGAAKFSETLHLRGETKQ